ncbi:MAG TPA: deoxynucleoside kinase [Myxococcaceae bacterium]|nr:deoxynucleoside kinase [Myxococcaceae bacterium]
MEHRTIVVEGPIGVGKTSLAHALAERFGARLVLEEVEENPFLGSFYKDRRKHAFQTQIFFLLSRFQQQQALFQPDLFRSVTVSDYLFAKDRLFAWLNLEASELALYERVYGTIAPRAAKPDLVIYLQARQEVLLQRIKRRGRTFERKFDPDYLERVSKAYGEFFFRYSETPLLVINTSDIDFVHNEADLEDLVGAVRKMKKGTQHYNPRPSRG